MKKYVNYLKSDLQPALEHLPDPETFEAMYGDGFLEGDLSHVPVKTLGEWLGIDMLTLPPSDRLTDEQLDELTNSLLSYWQSDDELVQVIRHASLPKRRYESAVEYLSLKGQYDGLGGFQLVSTPLTDEELRDIPTPLETFLKNRPKDSTPKIEDNDLPF